MLTRVVVYAGAPGTLRRVRIAKAPGALLSDSELGAAHVLVRRTIDFLAPKPTPTLHFEAPLNLIAPRPPRGSDLLDRKNLRRLLRWPLRRPDLAVVLVDEDGVEDRLQTVKSYLDADWVPNAVGVAVREFELAHR
jgi:hypothetical protein